MHANQQRVQAFLDAYAAHDEAALKELLDPDIVWHVGGSHPLAGDHRGRDSVLAYFREVQKQTGGDLVLEPIEIIANERHAAAFLRVRGQRAGQQLDVEMAEAFTIGEDGRLTEFFAAANDQNAVDAFWTA